ncbi:THAP domain-containing protein 2 [Monomorium pharaonis]|uniref:THAP domain-containing protein 2 n=1 Tax=Monomorium pharaonis TaxID=307658 RepID=UPI0017466964|nr:THAP domain-containing protein 2 [Monomorium pharaonis]
MHMTVSDCKQVFVCIMSFCVIFGCNNRINKKNIEQVEKEKAANKKFSFHLFPRDVEKRNKWLKALNLENYNPPKTAAVCSAHFKEKNYVQNCSFRKLKEDAVPYLSEERIACAREEHQETNFVTENIETDNINNTESVMTKIPSCNTMVHRSTSISPERILNSPIKTRLRQVYANKIKSLKRKLHLQNYNHKKMQTKLQSMKIIIKDLQKRNLITPDEGDILQHLEKEQETLDENILQNDSIQNINPVISTDFNTKMFKDSSIQTDDCNTLILQIKYIFNEQVGWKGYLF